MNIKTRKLFKLSLIKVETLVSLKNICKETFYDIETL